MPSNITAASHGGPIPATSISCPVDGEKIKAADIRQPVAALLANDDDLYTKVAAVAPDLLAANNTWTGTNTYQNKIILSGNGAGIRKRWGDVNDADTTLHTTKDIYLCEPPTATRTLTLAVTTAVVPQDGEEIALVVQGGLAGQYDVYYEGSAQPLVTNLGSASTASMASFVYRASTSRWYLAPGLVNGTVGTNAA